MRQLATLLLPVLLLSACGASRSVNPDPNHTHADFAVWIDGKQIDFSGNEHMSGSSDEKVHDHELNQHLHLHDGNGHVLHRHKPGLTLKEFFLSLSVGMSGSCYSSGVPGSDGQICADTPFRLFVNGKEQPFDDLSYIFEDEDKILITTSPDGAEVQQEFSKLSDDACLYSKTCPERGKAPTEGCIADPTVPCKL
jgi:hypothetical protein